MVKITNSQQCVCAIFISTISIFLNEMLKYVIDSKKVIISVLLIETMSLHKISKLGKPNFSRFSYFLWSEIFSLSFDKSELHMITIF